MNDLWLKIKVWTKAIIIGLLSIYVLLFAFNNRGQPVSLWVWGDRYQTSLLVVIFLTFAIGVFGTLLVRTTWKTYQQMRELRSRERIRKLERESLERERQEEQASKLRTRDSVPPQE